MSASGPEPPTHKTARPQGDGPGGAVVLGCDTCGAVIEVVAHERGAVCPFCATATVVERAPLPDRPRPTFTIGFALGAEEAERRARRHLARQWLAPERVRRPAAIELRAVYLPAYLWSAAARSAYAVTIGEDYEIEEEVEVEVDVDVGLPVAPGGDAGARRTERRTERRKRTRTETEWHEVSAQHACWLRDVFATASRGVAPAELEAIQPFELRLMRRHQPQLVAGWPTEEPSLARAECEQLAWRAAEDHARARIARQLPGDRWRELRVATRLDEVTLDLVLLPVWLASVPGAPGVRVLVNGQTGAAGGKVPVSRAKVALQVVLMMLLVAAAAWLVKG